MSTKNIPMNTGLDFIFEDIFRARRFQKLITKTLQSNNLAYAELEMLYILSRGKEYNPSELALMTVQSKSRVSGLLSTLQEKGYIRLERSTKDNRYCIVTICPKGIKTTNLVSKNFWSIQELK